MMADRTAWRICRDNHWWSVFGKKRGKGKKKARPPVHDDLVRRDFTAICANRLWLADITEHATGEGKLYLCAVKDAFGNRIVGYSIDERMKSRLAVAALDNAVARRGDVDGCILHSDRGSQFRSRKFVRALDRHRMAGIDRESRGGGDNAAMESFFSLLQKNVLDRRVWAPRRTPDRDRDLDRADLPPTPQTSLTRPTDPRRIRDRHDHVSALQAA